jgi:hypothetical protein
VSYIDTIAPSFPLPLDLSWVETWPHHTQDKGRVTSSMRLNFLGHKSILVTYHPTDMKGDPNPSLIYTFSLPKMVNKCNHDLVFDMDQAIEEANRLVNGHDKLPPVRIEEGILRRIDIVYQYQVGNHPQDYVASISNAHYSHREAKPYPYQGVVFPSNDATTKFYDKERQCHHPEAFGLLRHEKTLRGANYIGERCGKRNPTIMDIDNVFKKKELDIDLKRTGLNGTMICNLEVAVEKLLQYYGRTIGEKLVGYWSSRQGYTRDQMMSIYGYDNKTINRKEKMIQEAGVAMVSNGIVSLPSLCIEM